jgi:hypothetical protein
MGKRKLSLRKCSVCEKYKPLDQFSIDRGRNGGISSRCHECKLIVDRERAKSRKSYFAEYSKLHPEKRNAKDQACRACKNGLIKRGKCEICGSEEVVKHHDDYSKPLEIRWLCRKHHGEYHFGAVAW